MYQLYELVAPKGTWNFTKVAEGPKNTLGPLMNRMIAIARKGGDKQGGRKYALYHTNGSYVSGNV